MGDSMIAALTAGAALLASVAVLPGPATEALKPSSKWQLDYANNACRLTRTFGTGDDMATLNIVRGGSLGEFDVIFAHRSIPDRGRSIPVTLTFAPGGETLSFSTPTFRLDGLNAHAVFGQHLALDDLPGEGGDEQQVTIAVEGAPPVTLALGKFGHVLTALQTCYDDLLRTWGMDPVALHALRSPPMPIGNPAHWFSSGDYPREMQMHNREGGVVVRLDIGETGAVGKCTVVVSSGEALLDEATCDILRKRGRFIPAKAPDGRAVAAPWVQNVVWRLWL